MNISLWIVQILLAFYHVTGGVYTISNYEILRSSWANGLPKPVWVVLGILQVLFGLGLVLPGAAKVLPTLTPVSAIYLAGYSLLGCVLFAKYAGSPGLLWGVIPCLLATFVAYGRIALSPF